MSQFTKEVPVSSERTDIKAIEIKGLKMFITYEDGQTCEYNYEFVGGVF